ncbi:hypothetical protein F2P79_009541 [Pimephales promelas]|nr:hypothetical protein F2P79_009541 [Pimephales promelas]
MARTRGGWVPRGSPHTHTLSFPPAFGLQPRGDLTHAASCGGRPEPLKTQDVSPSSSRRQESARRDESRALPQESSTKASLHTADAKSSPSAAGFPSPHGD